MRHIIVDGYNVIRTDPRLQSLERVSLEHARNILVQTLASSPRLTRDEVIVVFDGAYGTRDHVHGRSLGRIRLLYSARGQLADDVIVTEAETLVVLGEVVVVSNDLEVRDRCRAAGCKVSGAENLLTQMPGWQRGKQALPDAEVEPTLSTQKHGNPRRSSRRERRRDVRF
jgi:uncharacterized protein